MKTLVKILKKPITSTLLAILCGFLVAAIVLLLAGYSPASSFAALFKGIFAKPKYISNVIIKATPIILTGLSVAFAFKTGLFNIGAEGQYIIGTVAAVCIGVKLNLPPALEIPIVVLSGVLAGAIYGGIVGLLKARFGIHEVITSIMLNWIAFYLSNYIVTLDAYHEPNSTSSLPVNESSFTMLLPKWKSSEAGMAALKPNKWLYEVMLKTDVNFGILIAILMAVIIWILLYRSTKGYELRAVGFNSDAAEFAGINVSRNIIRAMVISGALAGLAGSLAITGNAPHRIAQMAAFENNGFNGLSVALIAGSSPIGCIFAGLLFGGLLYGGQSVQQEVGAPTEIINIMIGTIVFFVALTKVVPVLADKLEKRSAHHAK
ncbi:ABC transporter permease [Caproiciproducens galactitolivorans]|uniref:ABC transporter permease n=1 Tax=Caproiciproducens galactitolivorans TaxID=642589 RepID=A0ABT4BPW0_9FIRM|nr:ABC transporter permease [Caproiciproducens galactitolivorans]MCY1712927.1 ABC transporter permease [Caproiciproducens galactitolivorans]